MKKIYQVILISFLGTTSFAQTSFEPNTIEVENFDPYDFEAVGYSFVTNQSDFTVIYEWTRNVIEITEGWTSAVCDKNDCYLSFISTEQFILPPDSVTNIDVHVYPDSLEGNALIEIIVEDIDDPENVVSGTYLFSSNLLSAPERITSALKIYPNPVVSEFFIDGADDVQRIEIYSITGKLVKEVQSFGQGSVNVEDLGTGNYIVRMWDNSNAQISTNVLSVQ